MTLSTGVPPDGKYGWVIVFAQALTNLVIIPLMQSFGLIFKDTFVAIGLSATQGSLIININSAFGMLTGLINGALLKLYGYRKVATLGAILLTFGIILTAFSTTFTHFLIAYGIITSITDSVLIASGMGLSISACNLAVNTYFKKNRGRAISISVTVTGFGPILMPQLINYLMEYHTIQGVTLILGGISAHSLISAVLLQPVKWHYLNCQTETALPKNETQKITINHQIDADNCKKSESLEESKLLLSSDVKKRNSRPSIISNSNEEQENDGLMFGVDTAIGGSVLSLQSIDETKSKLRHQASSSAQSRRRSFVRKVVDRISIIFDLDLLKDPIYVNIMIGMSLAIFAELNFSVLTAFILADLGLTTAQIATFLSVLGIADILFRFLAPYIGDCLQQSARTMYMLTLFTLIITRFLLLIFEDYYSLLVVAAGLGVAKGVRTVYMSLVIPTYVSLEQLPSASGIQMMVNVEVPAPIESVLFQANTLVELIDLNRDSTVISFSKATENNHLLAIYRCQVNVHRLDVKVQPVEGQSGVLQAYITSVIQPKSCRLMQYNIKPLSLHYRIYKLSGETYALNSLRLTGAFSLAEIHSWIYRCVPEVPEKPQVDHQTELLFQSSVVGTVLQCAYKKYEASFHSENLSTIAVVKEFLSDAATLKKITIDVKITVNEESISEVMQQILRRFNQVQSTLKHIEFVKTVNDLGVTQEERSTCLSEKYRKTFNEYKNLVEHQDRLMKELNRFYDILDTLFVDYHKLQGRSVTGQRVALVKLLNSGDKDSLIDFFKRNTLDWME